MNEDNPNPDQQMPASEPSVAPAPAPMPVNDVMPPVKTPPPQDDQAEMKPEETKPLKPTAPKMHASAAKKAIVATIIIIVVIAALVIYAYTKNK